LRNKIVETSNLRSLALAVEAVKSAGPGQPTTLLLTGEPGLGKTCALIHQAVKHDGVLLDVPPVATPHWMLCRVGRELGIEPKRSAARMYDALERELLARPRILAFDNWEPWPNFRVLYETFRILADRTRSPMVLTGMSAMVRELKRHAHLDRRIAKTIEFRPLSIADAEQIATELGEVSISQELIAVLHEKTGGSTAKFCVELAGLERLARRNGLKAVSAEDLGRVQGRGAAHEPSLNGAAAA
jgi:hypothetical protein